MRKKWKKGLALWVAVLALLTLLPMTALAEDAGNFSVTGGVYGTSYTYSSYMLTFLEPGAYMISGTSNGQEKIVVNASGSTAENPVHITLDGVDIQLDELSASGSAFEIASGTHVRLTLSGDNRLTGTADYAGLQAATNAHLTIDAIDPSDDYSGTLLAEGGARGAGIGGGNGQDGGTVTILSGAVTARNYNYAAGIGGGFGGNGGTVVISGGEVDASSGFSGAGIGGGSRNLSGNGGDGGSVTISGGRVAANGDTYGAGIGGGMDGSGGDISITGGQVLAAANYNGAGIGGGLNGDGGTISISGGVIDAQGGPEGGAGVGGGSGGNGGSITISGGKLTAVSLGYGAAIGGGSGGDGGIINISGTADIVARGDDYGSGIGQGAGIGGGYNGGGGTINISGAAVVKATGGDYGAGIGGGAEGDGHGGTISISGTANVFARGGGYAAGIGGGKEGNGGLISVSDTAVVDTTGGDYGAGIGGGRKGDGGTISISGGKVSATGGGNGAGIGGGDGNDGGGNGGVINISGGTITATGTGEGAGIGGGGKGDGAAVTITGGSICAASGGPGFHIGGGFNGSAGPVRDGNGRDVYLTCVTLEGVSAATGVTSLTVDSGAYGINNMYTDEHGTLYLYLPNGAHTTEARTASKRYTGYVTTYVNPYNSAGTLMWYRQIDADGTYSIGDYYASGQTLHIDGGLNVTLAGSAGTAYTNFQLECGAGVRLTLQDVSIDDSANEDVWPLSFTGTGNTLTLAGVNTMKAGSFEPGVRVETGTALTIDGTGTLAVTGGYFSAGIGGGDGQNGGDITIAGGTLSVKGGHTGAGIGGGTNSGASGGDGGTVTITGGSVTAEGGGDSAGIGGGYDGSNGTVNISGGTVNAYGGFRGAGIGGGLAVSTGGKGGTVNISGGTVTAEGGGNAAGIGGGAQGEGGTVTITGGTVFAKGLNNARDIGEGHSGSNGGSLNLSSTAAVFLKRDSCVAPLTETHTHQSITGHDGGSIYGIPVAWTGNFGAYLRIYTLTYDANGVEGKDAQGTTAAPATQLFDTTTTVADGSGLSLENYTFAGWNTNRFGSGTAYPAGSTFTFSADTVLYAQWTAIPTTNTVAVSANPPAGGTVSGGGNYSEGDSVTVTATPNSSYSFVNWTEGGTEVGTDAVYTFTMGTTDRTLAANFTAAGTLLVVSLTDPSNDATGISRNTDIVISFNRSVQRSVYFDDIAVTGGGSVVDYTYGINGNTLTLDPLETLDYGTRYTVTIPAGAVDDSSGNGLADDHTFSFTTRSRPSGGGSGGGGGSSTPVNSASEPIEAETGGSVRFGSATVVIPAGTLPADATLKVQRLTGGEAGDLVPSGLRVKLGSDIYEITTTGDRNFGDKTLAIRIAYDPAKIVEGEQPVIRYRDETTGQWIDLPTTFEQGADGKWYAVTHVNHLTKFAVFSAPVPEPVKKVIVLTLGRQAATVDGSPYTLDAVPFVDTGANRTLVPIRFVSEALGAGVDWLAHTGQVVIKDGGRELVLTTGSRDVLVNGVKQTIDCAPVVFPPGRTFVPLRFVSETLGATVDYDPATGQISVTR
jgi:hypothetical protein